MAKNFYGMEYSLHAVFAIPDRPKQLSYSPWFLNSTEPVIYRIDLSQ
jgi:hypothetical protein